MKPNPRLVTSLFFLVPALLAVLALTEALLIPSDPKNTVFLGLSTSRLALVGFLFVATISCAILTGFSWKQPARTRAWIGEQLRKKPVFASAWIVSIFLLAVTYAILAIPARYLHEFHAIHERARPLLTWLCITSFQCVLGLMIWSVARNSPENSGTPVPYKKILGAGIIILGSLLGLWIFIGFTRLGVWPGSAFWGKAGVPVLWPQILLALSISIAVQSFLINRLKMPGEKFWLDVGMGATIWLAAFLLWSNQSYIPGVFNTPPHPPAYQIFPFNDSEIYDLTAQNLLIGIPSTSMTMDKSLYVSFLAILHLLVGSNFSNLYLLQVAVFAFIPVLGYYLGKSLHSRQLGVMFAVILVFREQNAIALTNIIQVSTAKMMLSEMLTALGVLVFTLLLVKWLKHPDPMRPQLWMVGGVLGLSGLVRLNPLTIVPLALLLIGLALKFKLKQWLMASMFFIAFLGISLLPWSLQNFRMTNDPLAFIKGKTDGVIINNRYMPVITDETPAEAPKPEPPPGETPPTTPLPIRESTQAEKYLLLGKNISEHYMHNLISMTIMLPPSGALYQPADMVIRLPYWKLNWDGALQPDAYLILFMVLSFFSIGISTAWVRSGTAGIAPFLVVLGYGISTALALTSGGRYMVPMDWLVLFYFSIGVIEIKNWLFTFSGWDKNIDAPAAKDDHVPRKINYGSLAMIALLFVLIGSLPVLLEVLPPTRYEPVSKDGFVKIIETLPEQSAAPAQNQIAALWQEPGVRFEHGRAVYPRYYPAHQSENELINGSVLTDKDVFNRLTFYLIGTSTLPVILPIADVPTDFSADADIWIIGCDRGTYFEALLVIQQENGSTRLYQQSPPKMTCRN